LKKEKNWTILLRKPKVLLDTDLKIILLDYQNNFVEILKIMDNTAKNFASLATSLSVLQNYFDRSTKLLFWTVSDKNFRSFSKTIFFMRELIMINWKYFLKQLKLRYRCTETWLLTRHSKNLHFLIWGRRPVWVTTIRRRRPVPPGRSRILLRPPPALSIKRYLPLISRTSKNPCFTSSLNPVVSFCISRTPSFDDGYGGD